MLLSKTWRRHLYKRKKERIFIYLLRATTLLYINIYVKISIVNGALRSNISSLLLLVTNPSMLTRIKCLHALTFRLWYNTERQFLLRADERKKESYIYSILGNVCTIMIRKKVLSVYAFAIESRLHWVFQTVHCVQCTQYIKLQKWLRSKKEWSKFFPWEYWMM